MFNPLLKAEKYEPQSALEALDTDAIRWKNRSDNTNIRRGGGISESFQNTMKTRLKALMYDGF